MSGRFVDVGDSNFGSGILLSKISVDDFVSLLVKENPKFKLPITSSDILMILNDDDKMKIKQSQ